MFVASASGCGRGETVGDGAESGMGREASKGRGKRKRKREWRRGREGKGGKGGEGSREGKWEEGKIRQSACSSLWSSCTTGSSCRWPGLACLLVESCL